MMRSGARQGAQSGRPSRTLGGQPQQAPRLSRTSLDRLQKLPSARGYALQGPSTYTLQVSILNCHKKTLLYINSNTAFMLPPTKNFSRVFVYFSNFVCRQACHRIWMLRTNSRLPQPVLRRQAAVFRPLHIVTGCPVRAAGGRTDRRRSGRRPWFCRHCLVSDDDPEASGPSCAYPRRLTALLPVAAPASPV